MHLKKIRQSIWPVSVFGLGFLLMIIGVVGVANLGEARHIYRDILGFEDNHRHMEDLIEDIRLETLRVGESAGSVERMSSSTVADSGIELIDVPPAMKPGLKVLRGVSPDGVANEASPARAAMPRLRIVIGLGVSASLHEWPPGPFTVTRNRRLPSARVTATPVPEPSRARAAPMRPE